YKKKDGEWSTSQGRIKELEVLFHRSEVELTATLSEKQSLEAELADTRAQLAKVPSGITHGGGSGLRVRQQASSKGSVSIEGADPEGKFVQLKNDSDKVGPLNPPGDDPTGLLTALLLGQGLNPPVPPQDQSLGNWRLKRKTGEGEEIVYKFTPKYVLRAGQTVTIWASEAGVAHSPPSVLVWKNQGSWGSGDHIHTCLVNSEGEEVAVQSLTQLTTGLQENGEEEEEEEAEFGEEDLFHQQGLGRKEPELEPVICWQIIEIRSCLFFVGGDELWSGSEWSGGRSSWGSQPSG
ncbi:hypothetical protein L345_16952, partial [Ophiophagus hannah]